MKTITITNGTMAFPFSIDSIDISELARAASGLEDYRRLSPANDTPSIRMAINCLSIISAGLDDRAAESDTE